jgi:hypothetical protein
MPLALNEVWRNSILGCGNCQGKFPILGSVMWGVGWSAWGWACYPGSGGGGVYQADAEFLGVCAEFLGGECAWWCCWGGTQTTNHEVGCKRPIMPADVVVDPIGAAVRPSWRRRLPVHAFLCVTPASQGNRVNNGLGVTSLCDSHGWLYGAAPLPERPLDSHHGGTEAQRSEHGWAHFNSTSGCISTLSFADFLLLIFSGPVPLR